MTKIITRYFEDANVARAVRHELVQRNRFSPKILDSHYSADGLANKLITGGVHAETARVYQDKMASGGAVILVRAGYKPLGVAKIARETMDDMGAAKIDGLREEVFVADPPKLHLSIMQDHPLMLSRFKDPESTNHHMADWPIGLISRGRPVQVSIIPPHAYMANWPIGHISRRKPYTGSIFPRHARMANFLMPLLSKRKPNTASIFPRHARMANFPIPLISRRKPYTGTKIGRHTRMAGWPFPHLINGKQGTNALVPGGARMANFPISLLSDRKPNTASIFPRHARMANFPIGLISKRKPYTGSAIPRHGRMADAILPLVLKSSGTSSKSDDGFLVSKHFGVPTIIRR